MEHRWRKEIIEWAYGKTIEGRGRNYDGTWQNTWIELKSPCWNIENAEYRVKDGENLTETATLEAILIEIRALKQQIDFQKFLMTIKDFE